MLLHSTFSFCFFRWNFCTILWIDVSRLLRVWKKLKLLNNKWKQQNRHFRGSFFWLILMLYTLRCSDSPWVSCQRESRRNTRSINNTRLKFLYVNQAVAFMLLFLTLVKWWLKAVIDSCFSKNCIFVQLFFFFLFIVVWCSNQAEVYAET